MKGVIKFEKDGNFIIQCVGPVEITKRVGPMAYQIGFSSNLVGMHDIFHILLLGKYIANPDHVMCISFKVHMTLGYFPVDSRGLSYKEVRTLTSCRP